jgi:hypothetical protein
MISPESRGQGRGSEHEMARQNPGSRESACGESSYWSQTVHETPCRLHVPVFAGRTTMGKRFRRGNTMLCFSQNFTCNAAKPATTCIATTSRRTHLLNTAGALENAKACSVSHAARRCESILFVLRIAVGCSAEGSRIPFLYCTERCCACSVMYALS